MINTPSEHNDWPENPERIFEHLRAIRDSSMQKNPTHWYTIANEFALRIQEQVGRKEAMRTYLYHVLTFSSGVTPSMCDQFDFDGDLSVQQFVEEWPNKAAA